MIAQDPRDSRWHETHGIYHTRLNHSIKDMFSVLGKTNLFSLGRYPFPTLIRALFFSRLSLKSSVGRLN